MDTEQIQIRYSKLAEDDSCCLSCGSAIEFSKAKPGEICVDLGSGKGTDVLRLAEEVGDEGMAIGVDVSDGMLKKAEKNAKKMGIENAIFVKSELEDIKIGSDTVDLLISNCTINHAKDKFRVWSEIERILKRSGRFVVSDIYSTKEVPEQFRNDPIAVSECWAGAVTNKEYLDTLQKVGFKNIEIIEESAPYPKGEIEVVSFTISGTKKCCG